MTRRIQIRTLDEQRPNDDLRDRTPAELIQMVWPLTQSAWAFKRAAENDNIDEQNAESRLQRHLISIRKLGR